MSENAKAKAPAKVAPVPLSPGQYVSAAGVSGEVAAVDRESGLVEILSGGGGRFRLQWDGVGFRLLEEVES